MRPRVLLDADISEVAAIEAMSAEPLPSV
ncbi:MULTISPECIES: LEPR-XLL domain-containing protein [unclassified Bradyrhizobium]